MQRDWTAVQRSIDPERFSDVQAFLAIQEREARWWRDAALSYFQSFSRRPIPSNFDQPAHPLSWYEQVRCPQNRNKPRCDAIP